MGIASKGIGDRFADQRDKRLESLCRNYFRLRFSFGSVTGPVSIAARSAVSKSKGCREILPRHFGVVRRTIDSLGRTTPFLDRALAQWIVPSYSLDRYSFMGSQVGKTKLLANMISEIETAAYRRGFNDGLRASLKAVKGLRPNKQQQTNGSESAQATVSSPQPARQFRANSDQARVLKAIQSAPGMRGVEILRALETAGTPVHERTLRTALGRLKRHHLIEQHEERWYEIQAAGQSN